MIFQAIVAGDQLKLNNMEKIFGLSEFWGQYLDDEVQGVANDVQGRIQEDNKAVNEGTVREEVLRLAKQEERRIGSNALAIVKSFWYRHIAKTPNLLKQVVRTCEYDRL